MPNLFKKSEKKEDQLTIEEQQRNAEMRVEGKNDFVVAYGKIFRRGGLSRVELYRELKVNYQRFQKTDKYWRPGSGNKQTGEAEEVADDWIYRYFTALDIKVPEGRILVW